MSDPIVINVDPKPLAEQRNDAERHSQEVSAAVAKLLAQEAQIGSTIDSLYRAFCNERRDHPQDELDLPTFLRNSPYWQPLVEEISGLPLVDLDRLGEIVRSAWRAGLEQAIAQPEEMEYNRRIARNAAAKMVAPQHRHNVLLEPVPHLAGMYGKTAETLQDQLLDTLRQALPPFTVAGHEVATRSSFWIANTGATRKRFVLLGNPLAKFNERESQLSSVSKSVKPARTSFHRQLLAPLVNLLRRVYRRPQSSRRPENLPRARRKATKTELRRQSQELPELTFVPRNEALWRQLWDWFRRCNEQADRLDQSRLRLDRLVAEADAAWQDQQARCATAASHTRLAVIDNEIVQLLQASEEAIQNVQAAMRRSLPGEPIPPRGNQGLS